jgi:hypothetical protein
VIVRGGGASVLFQSTQHLESLTLDGGAATLSTGGGKVLVTRALNAINGGRLDLRDNDLVIDYGSGAGSPIGAWNGSSYTGVVGMIQSGRTVNGTWDGAGIGTSMSDAVGGLTGLGVGEAADVMFLGTGETALWNGETIDATSVIVKYTYAGDVNLDGMVDASDYGAIDNGYQFPGSTDYFNGDFNLDGVIDASDYGLIDNAFQLQSGPL